MWAWLAIPLCGTAIIGFIVGWACATWNAINETLERVHNMNNVVEATHNATTDLQDQVHRNHMTLTRTVTAEVFKLRQEIQPWSNQGIRRTQVP